MARLSAKPLPSTSDPMPSQYPGTQYATPPLDRAGFPLIYEGWERPSRRYDPHHTCRNTYEYDQSGPLYRDVIHPGVSKRTKTKTNAIHSHLPTHDHESKRAWVLNWRNSVSAESGTDPDEVSEPAMSDQDDEMASDSSDEEDMATHPVNRSTFSGKVSGIVAPPSQCIGNAGSERVRAPPPLPSLAPVLPRSPRY